MAYPGITHKSDVGGVLLNLQDASAVRTAIQTLQQRVAKILEAGDLDKGGVYIQEQVPPGVCEVVIGAMQDPVFGPVLMFGLGGIFVEVLKDVSFRVIPIAEGDARQMLEEIKGGAILKGVRGKEAADIESLVSLLLGVAKIVAESEGRIKELDLNPVVLFNKGYKILDVRVVTSER